MPIPTQTDTFRITLEQFADRKQHTRHEVFDKVRDTLDLTEEEQSLKIKSGKTTYKNRVAWGIVYLYRGNLLDRVKRGVYQINDEGVKALENGLTGKEFLQWLNKKIETENPWNTNSQSSKKQRSQNKEEDSAVSPKELIPNLVTNVNESLGDELISLILENDPYFFEKVVVDLIEKMGYGVGEVTQKTNDQGIDGYITKDELGFNSIYTQAKRYAKDNLVGRQEIQRFIGALNGEPCGVFITTSDFHSTAIESAASCKTSKVILINGKRLAELMIKYNVGVFVEQTYEIKRIDSDYFEDEF